VIFVTVGTQLPFERLIRSVDDWAAAHPGNDVFAQIGPSSYRPRHVRSAEFLDASMFRKMFSSAQLIVAHAGMGSIISALEMGKPIIVMPRRADQGEHRNDHQMTMVQKFLVHDRVRVALDEACLWRELDRCEMQLSAKLGPSISPTLATAIRQFVRGDHWEQKN
jgi:UDP-N-acetylglucosamine transferase subunit ALG13